MSTKVENIRVANLRKNGYNSLIDWLEDKNHVYVGRNMTFYVKGAEKSEFANPFKVKTQSKIAQQGNFANKKDYSNGLSTSLEKYEEWLRDKCAKDKDVKKRLLSLRGKVLGCWCKPAGCHGDVMAKLIQEFANEEFANEEFANEELEKEFSSLNVK